MLGFCGINLGKPCSVRLNVKLGIALVAHNERQKMNGLDLTDKALALASEWQDAGRGMTAETLRALVAEVRAARVMAKDAERYRWLLRGLCAYEMAAPMLDGRSGAAILFAWPRGVPMQFDDLSGSIDAAMSANTVAG